MKKKLLIGALLLEAAAFQAMTTDASAQSASPQAEAAGAQAGSQVGSQVGGQTKGQSRGRAVKPVKLESIKVFAETDPYFERQNTTALKGDVDEHLIPFTTNVLNEQVIEDLKADRLEKAFGYIPGFARSGTTANSFNIRGHAADLQNLQVDGLPGLTSRFGSLTTANIERVEVLKGPASVLYGWMYPGGLVNMITKKPEDKDVRELNLSGQVFPDYGDAGYSASIDINGRANETGTLLFRMIAGYENEDSFRDHVSGDRMIYAFPSLAWVPDATRRLDVQLEYTKEDRAADQGLFVLNRDIKQRADITTYYQEPGDTDNDEGYALGVTYEHLFDNGPTLNLKWRSVWHEDERDLYENNSVRGDDTLRRRNRHQYNERQYHFGDANLDIDLDVVTEQTLTVGVNGGYEYRQYDRLAFDTTGANVSLLNPSYTGNILTDDPGSFRKWDLYNIGIYGQDQIFVTDRLSLIVGGRYDMQAGDYDLSYRDNATTADESVFIQTTAYNGGLTYQVTEQASVYGSVSRSFNPQSIPTFDANNEQLDPEKGIQYEIGAKLSLLNDKLNMNFSIYDLTKENISETVNGESQLIGTIESIGTEAVVQYQPSPNWQFQAAYSYVNAEVTETTNDDAIGNVPGFVPKHSASLLARYNHPEEVLGGLVGMGLGWRFESERYTDEEASKRVRMPSYNVVDMNFYYELEELKLSFNVENVLGETYFIGGTNDTAIYVGDPRKFIFRAKYVF
jgi:iron complex outermembrane receptor protein